MFQNPIFKTSIDLEFKVTDKAKNRLKASTPSGLTEISFQIDAQ